MGIPTNLARIINVFENLSSITWGLEECTPPIKCDQAVLPTSKTWSRNETTKSELSSSRELITSSDVTIDNNSILSFSSKHNEYVSLPCWMAWIGGNVSINTHTISFSFFIRQPLKWWVKSQGNWSDENPCLASSVTLSILQEYKLEMSSLPYSVHVTLTFSNESCSKVLLSVRSLRCNLSHNSS